jgi:Fic family protein
VPSSLIDLESTPFCYENSQQAILDEISQRVQQLRTTGRLTPEVLKTIRRYFRIKNIYHSNAIEGNVLDVGETRQVVEHGLTLTGKPLKDQAEAKNLSQAIDYLEQLASKATEPIRETDVRQLHYLVLKGINDDNAGKYRTETVEIAGSDFLPPGPETIPASMEEFGAWLGTASIRTSDEYGALTALLNAAVAHTWLVHIHPFIDGNGRVARLLMNLILMRHGFPIAIITKEDRLRYYDALEISQSSNLTPFLALLSESLHESLEEYERAAEQQLEREEWAQTVAAKFGYLQQARVENEYEVWRSAMDLLKSYFRQTSELINEATPFAQIYFKDFGALEVQKYTSLRLGESAKKTWFFRIDFRSGEKAARYLFFFGYPSPLMPDDTEVTLHAAREEPENSFNYERLELIQAPNVPSVLEIGYKPKDEVFVSRERGKTIMKGKVEEIGKKFFDEVVKMHFSR